MFKIIQIAKNWNDTCVRGLEISHWKVRKYRPPLQSSQSNSPRDLRKAVVRLTTWFMHCDVETSTKKIRHWWFHLISSWNPWSIRRWYYRENFEDEPMCIHQCSEEHSLHLLYSCLLSWKRLGCKLLPTPPFLSDMLERVKVTIAWNVAWWRDLSCATACILENGADWLWRIARKVSVRAGRGGRG